MQSTSLQRPHLALRHNYDTFFESVKSYSHFTLPVGIAFIPPPHIGGEGEQLMMLFYFRLSSLLSPGEFPRRNSSTWSPIVMV